MASSHSSHEDLNAYFEEAFRFDFYEAVKTLEAVVRRERSLRGARSVELLGEAQRPDDEPVRFSSTVSLGFSPSDIRSITPHPKDGGAPVINVDFLGLTGARGPLPDFYAEIIRARGRLGDTGLRDFLDLFNHRLLSLVYRARQHNRPTLNTDLPEKHPFARYLLSLSGLGSPETSWAFDQPEEPTAESVWGEPQAQEFEAEERAQDDSDIYEAGLKARDLLLYSGLFWNRERSMAGLLRILKHFFGLEIRGEEMIGRWFYLKTEERSALSCTESNNRLGQTCMAGRRVWDPQAGFELSIGPLGWSTFLDFLPSGRRFPILVKLTRFYTRSAFDFQLRLGLLSDELMHHRPRLSSQGGYRLGWNSWLMTRKPSLPTVEIKVRCQ